MPNRSLAGKSKDECEAEFNISVNGLLILSEEEYAKKYMKDGKLVLDLETNREAYIDFKIQNLVLTYFGSMGSPITKLNAEMELKMLVEELEVMRRKSGPSPSKFISGLPEYVFSRTGLEKGSEFGDYKGLSYRICYGLTKDGKMDYSRPLYEFSKYCKCSNCDRRFKQSRDVPNHLTVTTADKNKFQEVFEMIISYTCNSDERKDRVYVRLEKEP